MYSFFNFFSFYHKLFAKTRKKQTIIYIKVILQESELFLDSLYKPLKVV